LATRIGTICAEWIRKGKEAHEIRQTFGKDWKEVTTHLSTDIVYLIKDASQELKQNIASEIKNKSLNANVRDVKAYIKKFNEAEDEQKKKMLKGSDTTPQVEDTNMKPRTFNKIFKEIGKVDKNILNDLEDIERKRAIKNLKHTTVLLMQMLYNGGIVRKKDFDYIKMKLKVKMKSIEERLKDTDVNKLHASC
jgi:hypothetical protein